jgi:hypothetical protein
MDQSLDEILAARQVRFQQIKNHLSRSFLSDSNSNQSLVAGALAEDEAGVMIDGKTTPATASERRVRTPTKSMVADRTLGLQS